MLFAVYTAWQCLYASASRDRHNTVALNRKPKTCQNAYMYACFLLHMNCSVSTAPETSHGLEPEVEQEPAALSLLPEAFKKHC